MRFFEYIEQARAQPESRRQRLAVLVALVGTLLIVVLWLGNLAFISWARSDQQAARASDTTVTKEIWQRVRTGWQILTQ